jgi:hypothetical protein
MNCVSSPYVSIAAILGEDFAVSLTGDLAGAKQASSTLEFTGMSESEAERIVATVWRILEAHALISPIVEVRFVNALANIRLIFDSAVDRALVENDLLRDPWSSTQQHPTL